MEMDPLTELNSILRTIRVIRETLPDNIPPPPELLLIAWEIVAEEMRQLRRRQQTHYGRGGA